jgi:hypothetical protein
LGGLPGSLFFLKRLIAKAFNVFVQALIKHNDINDNKKPNFIAAIQV